jgi:hypothetical protein
MMKIKHNPITEIEKVLEHFIKKDGVPITYVCTTDLKNSDVPIDVFFRETPHPKFGNRYFGIFVHPVTQSTMICDADMVESLSFGLVENDSGELEYSRSHHDFKMFKNGNMIDGGREYIRSSQLCDVYTVINGKMIKDERDSEATV